ICQVFSFQGFRKRKPPLDPKAADPQIGFRNLLSHDCPLDSGACSRPANEPSTGDHACGRCVCDCAPRVRAPLDWCRAASGDLSMTLEAAIASYLSYVKVEKGLSANTVAAYTRDLRKFAAFAAKGRRKLESV